MAAKASFFPYVAAAPAETQASLKDEAAALRKTLADKAKHNEETAAQRRTLDARRDEQVVARRESRKAERAAATRQAVHATRVALAKRVETARFAAEAAAERGASADAAHAVHANPSSRRASPLARPARRLSISARDTSAAHTAPAIVRATNRAASKTLWIENCRSDDSRRDRAAFGSTRVSIVSERVRDRLRRVDRSTRRTRAARSRDSTRGRSIDGAQMDANANRRDRTLGYLSLIHI